MTDDLFRPSTPRPFDLGRIASAGRLEPGWPCRWCAHPLMPALAGTLICPHCDPRFRHPEGVHRCACGCLTANHTVISGAAVVCRSCSCRRYRPA